MNFDIFQKSICDDFIQHIGIDLTDNQCHQLFDFMSLLIEKNKFMNLTAITDPQEIIIRHFVDSVILIKFYKNLLVEKKSLVDVGTGAGFPGIPLAVICPNCYFVLNDTLGKRINFLSEVISCIKIENVKLVKSRAEDFGNDKDYRESFDFAVSRGVSRFSVLSEYTLPLVKVGGSLLAYKMFDCDSELEDGANAIKFLGGKFHVKHKYSIVENEPERCIVDIKKVSETPKKYPRKAGTPSTKPL